MSTSFRTAGFFSMPPVIKNLIIINALFFLATVVMGSKMGIDLIDKLGLHYPLSEKFHSYQIITHMFMHGGFTHILFNMFGLWMFGMQVEQILGAKRFLIFYFVSGIGAAFTHYTVVYFEMQPIVHTIDSFLANPGIDTLSLLHAKLGVISNLVAPLDPAFLQDQINQAYQYKIDLFNRPVAVGASGAVYGVLLAFGMLFPNQMVMFIFPPIPIKAKYFVLILGVLALISTKTQGDSNVAHAAHLGGMIFGFLLLRIWQGRSRHPGYFNG